MSKKKNKIFLKNKAFLSIFFTFSHKSWYQLWNRLSPDRTIVENYIIKKNMSLCQKLKLQNGRKLKIPYM